MAGWSRESEYIVRCNSCSVLTQADLLTLQPAQDEGHQETYRGHQPYHGASLLVSLGHHGTGQHGQNRPRGERLDTGDQVPRSPGQEEVSEESRRRGGNHYRAPQPQDVSCRVTRLLDPRRCGEALGHVAKEDGGDHRRAHRPAAEEAYAYGH